jgi:hypothetical protein
LETLEEIFASGLPAVNRALIRHLESVQRDYMWDFVVKHWQQYRDTPDRAGLAYLLARRLAATLSGPSIQKFMADLGDTTDVSQTETEVPPMRYYVMPPVEAAPMAGDIYKGTINGKGGYWILLTPSCDMVTGRVKAEWALLAYCTLLVEELEYQRWLEKLPNTSNKVEEPLKALLRNNRKISGKQPERFHFLPGAIKLPDLVVDFQQLATIPFEKLNDGNLERISSLDSPFAEALLARFTRYFGRLGTPDLDLNRVLSKLQDEIKGS